MRIGIELNGVLRNTIDKIEKTYQKFYIDKTEGIETDDLFEYKFLSSITSLNLKEHLSFQSEEELFSFLYEEFPMEIFGHSQSAEYNTFNEFNQFYLEFRKEHDILIVSDEIGKSKPASLFFLSKFGCLVEKIKFYSNTTINSMWDEVDILVTSNPELIQNHPDNKTIIKYVTIYNNQIETTFEITEFNQLKDKLKQIIQNV